MSWAASGYAGVNYMSSGVLDRRTSFTDAQWDLLNILCWMRARLVHWPIWTYDKPRKVNGRVVRIAYSNVPTGSAFCLQMLLCVPVNAHQTPEHWVPKMPSSRSGWYYSPKVYWCWSPKLRTAKHCQVYGQVGIFCISVTVSLFSFSKPRHFSQRVRRLLLGTVIKFTKLPMGSAALFEPLSLFNRQTRQILKEWNGCRRMPRGINAQINLAKF